MIYGSRSNQLLLKITVDLLLERPKSGMQKISEINSKNSTFIAILSNAFSSFCKKNQNGTVGAVLLFCFFRNLSREFPVPPSETQKFVSGSAF